MTFAVKQGDPTPFNHDLTSLIMWCFKVMALVQKKNESSFTPQKLTMCRDNYNIPVRRKPKQMKH